jgi:hypothetical protein
MADYLERLMKYRQERGDSAPQTLQKSEPVGAPKITDATSTLTDLRHERRQWADVCQGLAEQLGWESVSLRPGVRVSPGPVGWMSFCASASLTHLRDQAYPSLMELLKLDRETKGRLEVDI